MAIAIGLAVMAPLAAQASEKRLLGTVAYAGGYLPGWRETVARLRDAERMFDVCAAERTRCTSPLVRAWVTELGTFGRLEPASRLVAVNRLVNRLRYRRDRDVFGTDDHWAGPVEFMTLSGDCEDFAIFKYFALRRLGFSDDDLRVVFVREDTPWVSHAVLAVSLEQRTYILDNLTDTVLPDDSVRGYVPLFSANAEQRWGHYVPARPVAPSPPTGRHTG